MGIKKGNFKNIGIVIGLILISLLLLSCSDPGTGENNTGEGGSGSQELDSAITELTPTTDQNDTSRVMQIQRTEAIPTVAPAIDMGNVSAAAAPVINTTNTEDVAEPVPTPTPDPENTTGNGTPLVFDVADCTAVGFGSFDLSMEDEILKLINEVRAEGHLEPMEKNLSLGFCSDVRAKEISYAFNHIRMNATYWYTVAPAYDKAELIASDYTDAQTIVDAWMSTSSGRSYLLSDELMSIGISVFKTNGKNYVVASIGI